MRLEGWVNGAAEEEREIVLKLPRRLHAWLRMRAQLEGIPPAETIREALEAQLGTQVPGPLAEGRVRSGEGE
ncbi:MAG: hypothetical protein R3185_02735 [Candidatus Thermoplasmatota archaeon]|nr:hypothetical protein [Candidatus Thermoplasmatota archaeon]